MADLVRVTVAPGAHITVTPHPSGLPVLKSLILFGGNTADVPPVRAAALYAAGLILHPITGALPPAPEPMRDAEMTISVDGGPPRSADGGVIAAEPATEALIMPPSSLSSPLLVGNHSHGQMPRPAVHYPAGHPDGMATITTADGQSWPNF